MAPLFLRHARRQAVDLADGVRFRLDGREAREAQPDLDAARTAAEWLDVTSRRIPGGSSQLPAEIVAFAEFARAREPRTFVEIGTEAGGTNFLLGRAIESIEVAVAVDVFVRNRWRLRRYARPGMRFVARQGDSSAPATVERVRRVLDGREIDLLLIDGDHSLAGVLADLRLYRPLVAPLGLIAFHDIVPDERLRTGQISRAYAGEVPLLWDLVRRQLPHWEFVEDWNQDGLGIGVVENVRDVEIIIAPDRVHS